MNLKKITAAAVLLLSMTAVTASAADFADVKGHWAERVINRLADAGVVSGLSDTEFNPDGTVTRAEFLKMALGAADIEETQYRSGECLDVKSTDWYAPCVQSALDKGLLPQGMIKNYSVEVVETEDGSKAVYSGEFNAATPIKREEMAYIAEAALQYSVDDADKLEMPVDLPFDDVSGISIWALDGVRHAYANSLVSGMDDGTFCPQQTATRAQAAVIISNLLDR